VARVEGLTKTEAEDLLDWLETSGRKEAEVILEEKGLFAVQWPCHCGDAPEDLL
jgi:hypothetical protein